MKDSVLVILPVYNEHHATVEACLSAVAGLGFATLVVDDGSDRPFTPVPRPRQWLLRHPINLGQGAALQTGMEWAARRSEFSVVVHFDADGQHDPASIESLLLPLFAGQADVVFGSRFLRREDARRIPFVRRTVLRLGRLFNRISTRVPMTDAHIGLRAMSRGAYTQIRLRENRMAHATELVWQVRRERLRWMEVPVLVTYSAYSVAKGQSSWNAFKIASDVLLRLLYP